MKPPQVVVFDLGKVLVDFDYSIAARRIAARSTSGIIPTRLFADHAPLLIRYELGLVTTRAFLEQMLAATGFNGTADEFGDSFADIFTPIQPMVELHAALRRNGFRTFIFSNTNELAVRHIRKRFPFFTQFNGYIYSYEHGAMKPDRQLYEAVERQTKHRGQEILYVDDRPENVEAGAARGWHVVLQESPEKTRLAVRKLGLPDHIEP